MFNLLLPQIGTQKAPKADKKQLKRIEKCQLLNLKLKRLKVQRTKFYFFNNQKF